MSAGKRQVVSGARQGDVEKALLLLFMVILGVGRQHAVRERTTLPLSTQWEHPRAQRGQVHDFELQPFARMDRHQAYRVDSLNRSGRLAECSFVAENFEATHPVEEVAFRVALICGFVLDGELKELMGRKAALLVGCRVTD